MAISSSSRGLRPGVCTSTTRPENPYDGMIIYETDTDKVAVYDVNAWVYKTGTSHVAPALVCVKAETAFSAVTSITADNVFTSTYSNYFLLLRYTTSAVNPVRLRFRAGGTSSTGANYNKQNLTASDTTPAAARLTGQTSIRVANATSGDFKSSAMITFFSPAVAEATTAHAHNLIADGAYTVPIIYNFFLNNTLATSFDGVELFVSTGTTTVTYAIYGY